MTLRPASAAVKAARENILRSIGYSGIDHVEAEIVEFFNTTDNEIDDDGHIWISNPCTGRWVSDDELISFVEYLD
jgi:hypothetical protein